MSAQEPNPDLFLMDVVWLSQFIRSGWLEPLSDFAERDSFPTGIFFEKIIQSMDSRNGTVYALPVFLDAGLLYFRTDLLSQYDFSPPVTWEELVRQATVIQAGERSRNSDINGFVWQGSQYEGLVCTFIEFITSHGGGIDMNNTTTIDSEENIRALRFMQELIHTYKISPSNTFTEMKEEEVRRSFQNGNALFERNWSYAWNLHRREESFVKDKFSVMPLPHFEYGPSSAVLGGWHIGISSQSDMKEEAWEFIRFVTSFSAQKKMVQEIGWNPAREDVYFDADLRRTMPHLSVFKSAFDHAATRPNVPYYSQMSEILQRNVNRCLAGGMSARGALISARHEIEQVVNLYEE